MYDRVVLHFHTVVDDILPNNIAIVGGVGADDVQEFLHINRFQRTKISNNLMFPHVLQYIRVTLPKTL